MQMEVIKVCSLGKIQSVNRPTGIDAWIKEGTATLATISKHNPVLQV